MKYTQDEINNIVDNASVLDYFLYLEKIGKVKFERKTGHDYYFRTDTNKFSVSEKKWYDYKTQLGGGAVKAVMALENKTWKETIDFLKDFNHTPLVRDLSERKANWKKKGEQKANIEVQKTLKPNNGNLIDYFAERGIEREILERYTEQIHYKTNDKYYFGIGLKNESGGYEIRNPYAKTKIGISDISIIKGENTNELMVFEGMTSMLSFLQMQKNKGLQTKRNIIILNSVTNTNKFIDRYKDFSGKVFLALDKDDAGDLATKQIIEGLSNSKTKDIRQILGLEYKQDLNDFLLKNFDINKNTSKLAEGFKAIQNSTGNEYIINKYWEKDNRLWLFEKPKNELNLYVSKNIEFKFQNLKEIFDRFSFQDLDGNNLVLFNDDTIIIQQKYTYNEKNTTQSTGVSSPITMGGESSERNAGEHNENSKSEQRNNNGGGQNVVGNNAGNGLGTSEQFGLERGERGVQGTGITSDPQPKNDEIPHLVREEESRQIGDSVGLRAGTDGRPSGNKDRVTGENDTGHHRDNSGASILPHRANTPLRGRLTNEQITEIINSVTEISDRKEVNIKAGASISEEVKDAASQYKSGGITKDGRGVLDEYYTDHAIVDVIRNLIKDNFKGKTEISVLEPSVGTGNFLHAAKDLGLKTNITSFEINETTAKIAKILYPEVNINLRSFETEFIDENGQPKRFSEKYDLVVGNPPYGQHRGYYKGIGEEPNISRYEDYFVKRSLDVLKEGGTLAMVLPSGWLNRQKNLVGAEITDAYRLPNGAFKGTDVGTDIIILKKNALKQSVDISNYFKQNSEKVLGEIATKTNQWAKEVEYVKGSLDDALKIINSFINKRDIQDLKKADQVKEIKKNIIGDLWGDWIQEEVKDIAEQKSIVLSQEENKKEFSEWEIELEQAKENLNKALGVLESMKFKSVAVKNKITHYTDLKADLFSKPKKFTLDDLNSISLKAEKTFKLKKTPKADSDYLVQNQPEIKKGVLKYQFEKKDEVVDAGLQNSPNLTSEQLFAFQQTDYDGRIGVHERSLMKYANVYNGALYHDFYYTEGDIYEKLEQLEVDFSKKIDWLGNDLEQEEQYNKQKALLQSVLPPKKSLEEIVISPNHEFVHQFNFGQKEKNIQVPDGVNPYTGRQNYAWEKQIVNQSLADEFQDFVRNLPSEALGKSSSWEVNSFVRNEMVTGGDKERNALVRERRKEVANDLFKKFLHEELPDDLKKRFVNEFNKKYNNIHIPDYSQFPLFSKIHQNFKGKPLNLTEVQKAGIGRLTTKGVGLLAHEVGFGKTLSGLLSMHEAMERGNAKRPLIVVPNDNILKQWVETIFETIPNAKVNILGNLGKDYDLSKFDNKDGEITLVTYEGFNNIGFSKETTQHLANKFSYISENELKSLKHSERDSQIEMQKKEELQGKMKKGKVYDWEDFGFDHLTFDEVHNANHIVGKVRIDDRRFASDFRNQQQRTSQLGINTWMASQYLQNKYDGRNVTLLSATPFTNKPLEYYSILSLVANDRLEKSGYFNINNFFETFMEADNDMEINAKGDIQYKTNVRRFKNNALFQQLLKEYIDIKGEEDNPQLKRPNRINKEYKIEQNTLTRNQYDNLNSAYDEAKEGAVLTHILNARLIAFSPYTSKFYDGEPPTMEEFIENSPKLKTTMDLIAQNKKDNQEAGQIIYSELAVSEFPKLREYLIVKVGYKPEEVEMITGATSKNKRRDIQDKFNQGKIKVIIGSEAIQEGMNLQQNTTDMYLLTLPYNFTSLRQTEGRAWRQGNKWENVRINFMLTNDSIDVFMLQKLQAKQSRYMEAIKNGANIIDVSDVDTQELKTAIITDADLRAKIEMEVIKKKLESQINRQKSELGFISRKFEKYVKSDEFNRVNWIKNNIENYSEYAKNGNEYWTKEVETLNQQLVDAEKKLKTLADNLAKQGINVDGYKEQQKMTEDKITELDRIIQEDLPIMEQKLKDQYQEEKEEQLRNSSSMNFVEERAKENKSFFRYSSEYKEVAESKKSEERYSVIRR